MNARTPTPWRVIEYGTVVAGGGHPAHDRVVLSGFALVSGNSMADVGDANTAYVVRCVNAHDALVAALTLAVGCMERDAVQIDGEWGECRDIEGLERDAELPPELVAARAALALAEAS